MQNISYEPTKMMRSAAGTARTAPGVGGTARNPVYQPKNNPASGVPATAQSPVLAGGPNYNPTTAALARATPPAQATPPTARPQAAPEPGRHSSKWAAETGTDPVRYATERLQMGPAQAQVRQRAREVQAGGASYGSGGGTQGAPRAPWQVGANNAYSAGNIPEYGRGAQPGGGGTAAQRPAVGPSQLGAVVPAQMNTQLQMQLQNPEVQNMFMQWLQQRYAQGLL